MESVEHLDATTIVEDEAGAKYEAERQRPGLVTSIDGSCTEGGATGYAVVWKKNQTWKGLKVHMGRVQEAYDTECAAIARTLETAARRRDKLDHLTIFTDAQAAIWRMSSMTLAQDSDTPSHIAELRRKGPGIRWYPSHCGVEGNEIADEWAKQAADEPDARGVEWHQYIDRCGTESAPTCSLAHIKRKCSEAKWVKAQLARTSNRKYRPSDKQKPNVTVAQANK